MIIFLIWETQKEKTFFEDNRREYYPYSQIHNVSNISQTKNAAENEKGNDSIIKK